MTMNKDCSIKVNRKYLNIYHVLAEGGDSFRFFPQNDGYVSGFVLSAFLGFREYQSSGTLADDFEGVTLAAFSQLSEYQQTILKVFAMKTKGYQILQNLQELISVTEKLADRGMEVLIGKVLKEYVQESKSGEYILECNAENQVEESLAMFIRDQLINNSLL